MHHLSGTMRDSAEINPSPDHVLLDFAFRPRSVAVVGASATRGKWSNEVFRHLVRHFDGTLIPINPFRQEVEGLETAPSLSALEHPVDYAIIVVPREQAVRAVEDCARADVPVVHVLTAGFSEVGGEGPSLQQALVDAIQGSNSRLIGPNSMGLFSAGAGLTFARDSKFGAGSLAFISQSGGLCYDVLLKGQARGLNFGKILSVGNNADLDWADYIRYFAQDEETSAIALYLESVGDGAALYRELRAATQRKPVFILKGGKTSAGQNSAASHTGRLAGGYDVWQAMFSQAGAQEVDSLEDMLVALQATEVAAQMSGACQAMIMGTGGGATVLVADACAEAGIDMAALDASTIDALAGSVPGAEDFGGIGNPLELGADRLLATPDMLVNLCSASLKDAKVGVVLAHLNLAAIANNLSGGVAAWEDICTRLKRHRSVDGHICLVLRNADAGAIPAELAQIAKSTLLELGGLSVHETMEGALRMVRRLQDLRTQPSAAQDETPENHHDAPSTSEPLKGDAFRKLAASYGVAFSAWAATNSIDEAIQKAHEIGFPVALKTAAPDIVHKSDVGCVRIGIADDAALRSAHTEIVTNATVAGSDHASSVLVEQMVDGLAEIVIGVKQSVTFGPVILAGAGGTWVEVMKDRSLRLCPVSEFEAIEMLQELRCWPLLDGARGRPKGDVAALARMISGISRLALDHPEIIEMELNPVIVGANKAIAVDARASAARNAEV